MIDNDLTSKLIHYVMPNGTPGTTCAQASIQFVPKSIRTIVVATRKPNGCRATLDLNLRLKLIVKIHWKLRVVMTLVASSWLMAFSVSWQINSLAPGKFELNFIVIFKVILVIDGWSISCQIALRWMSLDPTDDKSTLVPVLAWCPQATNH